MVMTCGFLRLNPGNAVSSRLIHVVCFFFFSLSLAVAIYTGMETKMALNYQSKSQKRSAVEKYEASPPSQPRDCVFMTR